MIFKRFGANSLVHVATSLGLLGGTLLTAAPALATSWYVDGAYGKDNYPGTSSQPFRSFSTANGRARPGDTIYLKPTTTYSSLFVTTSGSSGKPITISGTGAAPNLTRVSGNWSNFGIWLNASYITIQNLNVTAPGGYSGIHVPQGRHHDTITRNVIQGAGGDGIDLIGTDYMTISYNTVYGNSRYTANGYFNSGISVKGSLGIDSNTGTKMNIIGNIVYANTNVPNCGGNSSCLRTARDSDGSGIILDNNRRTDIDNRWYNGRFLVANNVVFGNGGRGIHMYLSDHITVNGNTLYMNNQDPYEGSYRPGEITGNYVSDVGVYNNILYSDGGMGVNNGASTGTHVPITFMYCYSGSGQITIANNIGYRPQNDSGSMVVTGSNSVPVVKYGNLWGNPKFKTATLSAGAANFRVMSYSQAVDKGLNSQAMPYDILGVARRAPTTIGAYENPTN